MFMLTISGYNPYGHTQTPYPTQPTTTTAGSVGGYPGMYGQGTGYGNPLPYPQAPGSTGYPVPGGGGPQPVTTIAYPTSTAYPGYPATSYPTSTPVTGN